MLFKEKSHKILCEKYGFSRYGGIRCSKNYPFIMVVYNPASKYENRVVKSIDNYIEHIWYQIPTTEWNDNDSLRNHKTKDGIYHSVFLFRRDNDNIDYEGEFSFVEEKNGYFELERIRYAYEKDEKVYFVENVIGEDIFCTEIGDRAHVIDGIFDDDDDDEAKTFRNKRIDISQGDYLDENFNKIDLHRIVNYNKGDISPNFVMKNESSQAECRVAHQIYFMSVFNDSVAVESRQNSIAAHSSICEAYLYTVNVGCGLTNFLVLVKQENTVVWALDWGSGRGYTIDAKKHIKDCMDDIKDTFFGGGNFTFEKIYISHGDVDHYNRIDDLYVDSNTEVWISGYNLMAGRFINMLNKLKIAGAHFYMSLVRNSNAEVTVLHPKQPIVFCSSGMSFIGTGYYCTNDKNDVSPIIEVKVNDKNCIFPGDIMQNGWRWFYSDTGCSHINASVYIHSHHGSKHGFVTDIPVIGADEYDMVTSEVDILSSRDNAYPGTIPSKEMISKVAEYSLTYKTQLLKKELNYYKTNIITGTVDIVY